MRLVDGMVLAAVMTIGIAGCARPLEPPITEQPAGDHTGNDHADGDHVAQDHSGWWCIEHGVPEEECALCDTSLVAEFQSKGDWCDEHNRPASQCFTCTPENFTKFAARYEAKFGEQPPQPTQ